MTKTGTRALVDNLLMAEDDNIRVETARMLFADLGFGEFDPTEYDH